MKWVGRQRGQYRLRQEGGKSRLNDEGAAELESLGFVWNAGPLGVHAAIAKKKKSADAVVSSGAGSDALVAEAVAIASENGIGATMPAFPPMPVLTVDTDANISAQISGPFPLPSSKTVSSVSGRGAETDLGVSTVEAVAFLPSDTAVIVAGLVTSSTKEGDASDMDYEQPPLPPLEAGPVPVALADAMEEDDSEGEHSDETPYAKKKKRQATSEDEIHSEGEHVDGSTSAKKKSRISLSRKEQWDTRFEDLLAYKAQHGHCCVPRTLPVLGRWVKKQREQYKRLQRGTSSSLTSDRLERLESVGFVWDFPKPDDWNMRFEQLYEYKLNHGNCMVPKKYAENPQLGRVSYV